MYVINRNWVKEQGRYWEEMKRHLRKYGFGAKHKRQVLTNSRVMDAS